jgi:hypothetical protein
MAWFLHGLPDELAATSRIVSGALTEAIAPTLQAR